MTSYPVVVVLLGAVLPTAATLPQDEVCNSEECGLDLLQSIALKRSRQHVEKQKEQEMEKHDIESQEASCMDCDCLSNQGGWGGTYSRCTVKPRDQCKRYCVKCTSSGSYVGHDCPAPAPPPARRPARGRGRGRGDTKPCTGGPSMKLQRLDSDLVEALGARCMDGSGGGYYWAEGSGANQAKLLLDIQGGGQCRSAFQCKTWKERGGSSNNWPTERYLTCDTTVNSDFLNILPKINPDFHDWSKIFLPYCSGDMHSGTRKDKIKSLGDYYFAGHNLIEGMLAQLERSGFTPSTVLVFGASAGGAATIYHADFFADHFKSAVVKASPAAGFFWHNVESLPAYEKGMETPLEDLGLMSEWNPYMHEGCAEETSNDMPFCTTAYTLFPFIKTPLFVRENQFDFAHMGACGLSLSSNMSGVDLAYLKHWGKSVRATLMMIKESSKDGFYSPSCTAHSKAVELTTAAELGGVPLQIAMHNWFFDESDVGRYTLDDGCDLPCTQAQPGKVCKLLSEYPEVATQFPNFNVCKMGQDGDEFDLDGL